MCVFPTHGFIINKLRVLSITRMCLSLSYFLKYIRICMNNERLLNITLMFFSQHNFKSIYAYVGTMNNLDFLSGMDYEHYGPPHPQGRPAWGGPPRGPLPRGYGGRPPFPPDGPGGEFGYEYHGTRTFDDYVHIHLFYKFWGCFHVLINIFLAYIYIYINRW